MSHRWLVLAAALLACVPAARAGAPDWLRAAAAESLPQYPNDTVAVILLDEQVTSVKQSGDVETTYRRAYKILRPEGREYGTVIVGFGQDTRLTYLKAWSIPPDGKEYETKEKEAVETSLFSASLYEDTRQKVLYIPAADPGNIIAYEYVQKGRPYIKQEEWWFQQELPVRRARLTLNLPTSSEIRTQWVNFPDKNPEHPSDSRWMWELENIPAVRKEPDMPPRSAVVGRLLVAYAPRGGSEGGKGLGSWQAIGTWFNDLAASRRLSTPQMKQKVAELTAGAASPREQLERLAAFVQQRVRYVAIEIGIGGYQPHPAGEVFTQRFGDCKDKATLLATMLGDVGISSYYIIVHSDRGEVLPNFPSMLSFNHVILAIRLPPSIPGEEFYATINHPKLGWLLLFDPTDRYTRLGYLPANEQGSYGLLATEQGGDLIQLPLLPPAVNRLLRQGQFSLDASGALSGTVQELLWGEPAATGRARYLRAEPNERPEIIENYLTSFLPDFRLTRALISNMEPTQENLGLVYQFVSAGYARHAGNLLLLRPRVLGHKGIDLPDAPERHYPVQFDATTLQTDQFEITLPPGFVVEALPPAVKADYSFGFYSSSTEVAGNVLHYQRFYQIKQVTVPEGQLGDLRDFFGKITADERALVVLRRASN